MSSRDRGLRAAAASGLVAAGVAGCAMVPSGAGVDPAAVGRLGVGRAPTAAEIRGWDIDIGPDGRNLPPGSGTVAQGRALYAERCASCHGDRGQGTPAPGPALAGGAGTLKSKAPRATIGSYWPYATTLYDYVYRAMPFDRPQTLRPDEVYALTAFLLNLNGVVGADAVMDAKAVVATRMPNRDGFAAVDGTPDLRVPRCMRDCKP